jgi:hypothetical protein
MCLVQIVASSNLIAIAAQVSRTYDVQGEGTLKPSVQQTTATARLPKRVGLRTDQLRSQRSLLTHDL